LLKDYEKAEENFSDAIKIDSTNELSRRNASFYRNRAKCHIEQVKFA
jgi:hypothetical protein